MGSKVFAHRWSTYSCTMDVTPQLGIGIANRFEPFVRNATRMQRSTRKLDQRLLKSSRSRTFPNLRRRGSVGTRNQNPLPPSTPPPPPPPPPPTTPPPPHPPPLGFNLPPDKERSQGFILPVQLDGTSVRPVGHTPVELSLREWPALGRTQATRTPAYGRSTLQKLVETYPLQEDNDCSTTQRRSQ